jgi:hypothetical protein
VKPLPAPERMIARQSGDADRNAKTVRRSAHIACGAGQALYISRQDGVTLFIALSFSGRLSVTATT